MKNQKKIIFRLLLSFFGFMSIGIVDSQILNLPPRDVSFQTGTQVVASISSLTLQDRELYVLNEVMIGNVPDFYRNLVAIQDSSLIGGVYKHITYYTIPDYLALGSETDYFLIPLTPIMGQIIADSLDCKLPTRKMVNQIWSAATVKMQPESIAPSPQMTTVPVFDQHNGMVGASRQAFLPGNPLGELVSGDKKDVVISNLIYTSPAPARVVIYGWHYPTGGNIQPLYAGHIDTYADYSHGIRLVQNEVWVDGVSTQLADVLNSSTLNVLLSDEGVISQPFYPDTSGTVVIPLPEKPKSFCVLAEDSVSARVIILNDANVTSYNLYHSLDGSVFNSAGSGYNNDFIIGNLLSDTIHYFKIEAVNSSGVSALSEVLAFVPSNTSSSLLIVNGFDRATAGNTFDFIRQHGSAIYNYGVPFSSATNDAIVDSLTVLSEYSQVDYILGEESTVDESFSDSEQLVIQNYLDNGGHVFVSGAEVGWDLDYLGSGSDQYFYQNYLKSQYVFDSPNDEPGVYYLMDPIAGGVFENMGGVSFDDGTNGVYDVVYPDVIEGINGGLAGLSYSGLSTNIASVYFEGEFPGTVSDTGKIVYMGVPFETIYPESSRDSVMSSVLDFFLMTNDSTLSNVEIVDKSQVLIYPNPSNGEISLKFNSMPSHVNIIDVQGRLVYSESDFHTETVQLNIGGVEKGIYIVQVLDNGHVIGSEKLVIR